MIEARPGLSPGRAFCRTWDSCVNANRKEQIRADIRMTGGVKECLH